MRTGKERNRLNSFIYESNLFIYPTFRLRWQNNTSLAVSVGVCAPVYYIISPIIINNINPYWHRRLHSPMLQKLKVKSIHEMRWYGYGFQAPSTHLETIFCMHRRLYSIIKLWHFRVRVPNDIDMFRLRGRLSTVLSRFTPMQLCDAISWNRCIWFYHFGDAGDTSEQPSSNINAISTK